MLQKQIYNLKQMYRQIIQIQQEKYQKECMIFIHNTVPSLLYNAEIF